MSKTLRGKQLQLMAEEVLQIKNAIKKWYNFIGIRYLQERELTDEQEDLLCDITDYMTDSIDKLEKDESFIESVMLPPVKLPKKKVNCLNKSI